METTKVNASTQEHLDIYDIKEDMVILKNGAASAVIQTSAINFELLSQREQDAAIFAYSGLLNSISFPMQVIIKNKKMDISNYIDKISEARKKIESPLLQKAAEDYQNFVSGIVQNFETLDKSFYVAITYNEGLIVPGENPFNWLKDLLGFGHRAKSQIDVADIAAKAKSQLSPKTEHIVKEFRRINIQAKRLNTEELIKLFYEYYNPESTINKEAQENVADYTTPMVETLQD